MPKHKLLRDDITDEEWIAEARRLWQLITPSDAATQRMLDIRKDNGCCDKNKRAKNGRGETEKQGKKK